MIEEAPHYQQKGLMAESGLAVEVTVSTLFEGYGNGETAHYASYGFDEDVDELIYDFRESESIVRDGQTIHPIECGSVDYSGFSLALPVDDRVDALEYSLEILEEVDKHFSEMKENAGAGI